MATEGASKRKEMVPKKQYLYDMVKSDGQFKEMITMQELARDEWETRWGFLKRDHILKIYEEFSGNLNLPRDFMINRRAKKTFTPEYIVKQPMVESPPLPTLTSGMVGWRSSDNRCSLEIVGALYVSPTSTIDPPWREQDLPLHQTHIHLG